MRFISFSSVMEGRKNNFDFLRFLLAILVIAYHCFPLTYGAAQPSNVVWVLAERGGTAAVPFFFIISGFLITQSWVKNPNLKLFLTKRTLRIFPAFIAAAVFCALIVGPLSTSDTSAYWQSFKWPKFLVYLFLLPADVVGPDMSLVFPSLPFPSFINGSFWTLRYEFECYVLVAFLGLLGFYKGKRWILCAFALLLTLWTIQSLTHWQIFSGREIPLLGNMQRWARLLTFFLTGMTFYLYRARIPYSRRLFWISFAAIGLSIFSRTSFEVVLPLFGGYCLLYVAFNRRVGLQNFGKHGDYSYGLYLYAFPIQQLLIYHFKTQITALNLFPLAFVFSLMCAFFSWHLVEKRFLQLKNRGIEKVAR